MLGIQSQGPAEMGPGRFGISFLQSPESLVGQGPGKLAVGREPLPEKGQDQIPELVIPLFRIFLGFVAPV